MQIITGACDTAWGARVYPAGTAVVIGSWTSSSGNAGRACPAMALMRYARATLARPLGSRVVLDVASGNPLVLGSPMGG